MELTRQQFWRAEVYTEENDKPGTTITRKLFAGIYQSHKAAENAAHRLCEQVKGIGFYIHTLNTQ